MTIIPLHRGGFRNWLPSLYLYPLLHFIIPLLLLWWLAPSWIYNLDPTAAIPDAGLLLIILIGIITFLILVWLAGYLLYLTVTRLGLPSIQTMVLQFNQLTLWHQFVCYWASFALLLLAAIGSLIAIC